MLFVRTADTPTDTIKERLNVRRVHYTVNEITRRVNLTTLHAHYLILSLDNFYTEKQNSNKVLLFGVTVFTAQSSYTGAVLRIAILFVLSSVCLSVCLFVTRVLCDKIHEHTTTILTPYERVITLVFLYQQRLLGDVPFYLKFMVRVTHISENADVNQYLLTASQP